MEKKERKQSESIRKAIEGPHTQKKYIRKLGTAKQARKQRKMRKGGELHFMQRSIFYFPWNTTRNDECFEEMHFFVLLFATEEGHMKWWDGVVLIKQEDSEPEERSSDRTRKETMDGDEQLSLK